jgi:hypothetical protein
MGRGSEKNKTSSTSGKSGANGARGPNGLDIDDHSLGHDEIRAHGERRGVPGETIRTQGVVESFELMDPAKRAAHMKGGKKH